MSGNKIDQKQASLQYLANDEELAVYIASVGGGEVVPHQGNYMMQTVSLENGRIQSPQHDLDGEGFRLMAQRTRVRDFYNDSEIVDVYESEIRALMKKATAAERVEIFDHTRRTASEQLRKQRKIREPAAIIHNDYTARSGPRRLRDYLAEHPGKSEELRDRRFAIVNVWRSINGPVQNFPLVMCDARSVSPEDLVSVTRQAKDRMGEIQLATYSPAHRWVYFPDMQMDEALLLKTYDSASDGRTRFTIHSSFDDPDAPQNAPPRESIETRCFVFY